MKIFNLPDSKNKRLVASALAIAIAGTAVVTSPVLLAQDLALEEVKIGRAHV